MDIQIEVTPGFCPSCGSILPQLKMTGNLSCFVCEKTYPPSGKLISGNLIQQQEKPIIIKISISSSWQDADRIQYSIQLQ